MTDTPRYKALQILRIRMAAPRAWRGHVEVFVTPRFIQILRLAAPRARRGHVEVFVTSRY